MYDENTFLNRVDAAQYIGVSTRTLDRYIAKGKLSVTRENGHVLLLIKELDSVKNEKNTTATQVINNNKKRTETTERKETRATTDELALQNQFAQEVHKYQVLYQDVKQELDKKDELLRHMHYQLGILETEGKSKIPALEAQNERQELEKNISTLEAEKKFILEDLKTARSGRNVFFIVSLILLFLLFIFFLIMGNLA